MSTTIKKNIKKAQLGDLIKSKRTSSGSKYKYKSDDGNYTTKIKYKAGEEPSEENPEFKGTIKKRRTLKGFLSGAPKPDNTMKSGGKLETAKDGKWIQKAIKKPGALRKQLGAKPGKPIPAGKLAAAAKKPGKLGQRARLAQTLKKMKKK